MLKEEFLENIEIGLIIYIPNEEITKLKRIQLEKRLQWGFKPTLIQSPSQLPFEKVP